MTSGVTIQNPKKARMPSFQPLIDSGNVEAVIEKLTEKQRLFVKEFFIDFNASDAIRRAGYTTKYANRMGSQMLSHPGIRFAIEVETKRRAEEFAIKPEYVLRKVVKTIEAADLNNNHTAVLKGCELLARHLGMFIERTEVSGPNGDPIRYEQVKEAADAFTSAISSLIEREGTRDNPIVIELRDPSGA